MLGRQFHNLGAHTENARSLKVLETFSPDRGKKPCSKQLHVRAQGYFQMS